VDVKPALPFKGNEDVEEIETKPNIECLSTSASSGGAAKAELKKSIKELTESEESEEESDSDDAEARKRHKARVKKQIESDGSDSGDEDHGWYGGDEDFEEGTQFELPPLEGNERRIECDRCEKMFASEKSLRAHQTKMHPDQGSATVCVQCSKVFAYPKLLKLHMRCHTDERAFSCDTCGKTFKHRASLRNHKFVHLENGKEIRKGHRLAPSVRPCGDFDSDGLAF
jgi:hypothetical protein